MAFHRLIRAVVISCLSLVAAWWLFADTVERFRDKPRRDGPLRFSYWGSVDDRDMWQAIIDDFNARHPAARVKGEWLSLAGYATKLEHQFIAGDAPDIILFQDEPFARAAARGVFAPLDEWIESNDEIREALGDGWPGAKESFVFEHSTRGVPVMGGNVLVYCNLDAFERASSRHGRTIAPPSGDWTLDDFIRVARETTLDLDGDGTADQFGFLQPHWVYYLPFLWAHGADLLDESRTRWTFHGPDALAALRFYADLRHRHRVTPLPQEYAGQSFDAAFLSGRAAMCVNGPWLMPFLNQTRLRGRYAVAPVPRGPAGAATRVTWDALCIYAHIPQERNLDARRFVRYVTGRTVQEFIARRQRAIPSRRAAAEAFIAADRSSGAAAQRFIDAMATARVQPVTVHWERMSRALHRCFDSLVVEGPGRRSPQKALEALAGDPEILESFGAVSP